MKSSSKFFTPLKIKKHQYHYELLVHTFLSVILKPKSINKSDNDEKTLQTNYTNNY